MQVKKIVIVIFVLFSKPLSAQTINIKSYNVALARALGHDFNPCVRERLEMIKQKVLIPTSEPEIYLLQEVFYTQAYTEFKRWAAKNNYYITRTYSPRSGLVILTNIPVIAENFESFSCNKKLKLQGTLSAKLNLDGNLFNIANTHTLYSEGSEPSKCHQSNLDELINQVTKISSPKIFGGDINLGPDITFHLEKYSQVTSLWLPFIERLGLNNWKRAETPSNMYTWNTNNPLTQPFIDNDPKKSRKKDHGTSTLDHIFVDHTFDILATSIIYSKPEKINGCELYQTEPGMAFMSDHFGISAKVQFKSTAN